MQIKLERYMQCCIYERKNVNGIDVTILYFACPPSVGNIHIKLFKIFIKNLKNAVRASLVLLIHDCGSNF